MDWIFIEERNRKKVLYNSYFEIVLYLRKEIKWESLIEDLRGRDKNSLYYVFEFKKVNVIVVIVINRDNYFFYVFNFFCFRKF